MDWIDWISLHGKKLLYGFALLFALLFTGFHLLNRFGSAGSDIRVGEISRKLRAAAYPTQELLAEALQAIKKHPELESEMGGLVAQQLLERHDLKGAISLAERGFRRVGDLSPFYTRFARNAFLIEKGEYVKALEEARAFKVVLERRPETQASLLYLCNLLRITSLQMKLGNLNEEKMSWKALLEAGKAHPKAWGELLQSFQKEELSLLDFISQREAM